ncbi:hypothetical protein M388_14965, partial [Mesotoga sp. Brook.08.YT.4.2.5.4.]
MAFRFKDLEVWKLSKDFARDIYSVTSTFPEEERYALVSQLRRAAVSVMSNIAEGPVANTERNSFISSTWPEAPSMRQFLSWNFRSNSATSTK